VHLSRSCRTKGGQFFSKLIKEINESLQIKKLKYHSIPPADRTVWWNASMDFGRSTVDVHCRYQKDWDVFLPYVLFALPNVSARVDRREPILLPTL